MKRSYAIVLLIFLIFFVISFITNILGPIIPDIIKSFNLSLTLAGFLPFAFFIAYGFMSIPSGMLVERFREKRIIFWAFLLAFLGSILFAVFPNYKVAIISLFIIGAGMAMLQVAINPLLRVSGGEEHFALNSVIAQLVFGGASFISPHVYSYLVLNLKTSSNQSNLILSYLSQVVPNEISWVSLYWLFTFITLLMIALILIVKLPKVSLKASEKAGIWKIHRDLFKNKIVILYFIGIFAYVGSEQGVANWISEFLLDYHGFEPQTTGANTVSYFWGLLTLGCLLGVILLKFIDSRKVLILFTGSALISLSFALFGSAKIALFAFPLTGFCFSVMWSVIFSLALNSVKEHHGSFSGILCTAIIGGALVPLAIGWIGDLLSLRIGMLLLFLTLGFILCIGFWSKPLISNKVIKLKKKKAVLN
jgi:FHS family L-fucose permease-like MFS transporter